MATQVEPKSKPNVGLPARQVYSLAAICLAVGLVVGYVFLGSNATPSLARPQASAGPAPASPGAMGNHPKITVDQMKQMADVQAHALVEKSKSDPKNAKLLVQIAAVYQSTHQFKEAADYYDRALKIEPKNTAARTQMASCLFYSGNADGALHELNLVLKSNPKDTNALFNLGMIKYRGKKDNAGAIAAWEELLKANPNLDRKPMVEQLIAEAKSAPPITKN
jgi:cytochrome c-type biogenesis protein CcmH/NrfG